MTQSLVAQLSGSVNKKTFRRVLFCFHRPTFTWAAFTNKRRYLFSEVHHSDGLNSPPKVEFLPCGWNKTQVLMCHCMQDRWTSGREHMLEHLKCKLARNAQLPRRMQNIWLINFHPLFFFTARSQNTLQFMAEVLWPLVTFWHKFPLNYNKLLMYSQSLLFGWCLIWLRTPAELRRRVFNR